MATVTRMGRKPLPPEERRAKPLRIRLTDAEREEIDRAADGQSSTWAREVLLSAARKAKKRK
jgi:uncharacterized protein (DUF1778 family)